MKNRMDDPTVRERVHDLQLRSVIEEQLVDRLGFIKAKRIRERKSWDEIVNLLIAPKVKPEDPGGVNPALTVDRLTAFCRRGGRNKDGWADPVGIGKGRKRKVAAHPPASATISSSQPTVPAMPSTTETKELKTADQETGAPEAIVPVETRIAASISGQQIDAETRKRNQELALAERRAKREQLKAIYSNDWGRHVYEPEFDYNLSGNPRVLGEYDTWEYDNSWFDLP